MRKPKTISADRIENALMACLPGLTLAGTCMYEYELPTALGKLLMRPCEGAFRPRFEGVPPAATSGASLNPYSGKWNFEGLDDDTLVGRAIYWIERVAS